MTEKILAVVERMAAKPASFDTPLEELGLDSLEMTDLLLEIERETGVELEPLALARVSTVGELAAAFLKKAQA